jgi:hypothetical protein
MHNEDDSVGQSLGSSTFAMKELEESFAYYVRNATSARFRYHTSEVALLVVSASVPVAALLASQRWVPATLGAVVVVIVGLRRVYSWHEDWLRFSEACEDLKRERLAYETGADPYSGKERDALLMARMMDIETAETQRWQALRRAETKQEERDS